VVQDASRVVRVAFIGPGEGCRGGEGGVMAGEGGWLQWSSKSARHGGLRRDLKRRGVMVGRVTARGGISRCGAAARRGRTRRDSTVAQSGSAGMGWRKELTSWAYASARGEREGAGNVMRESKKKTSSAKYAKGTRGSSG
jgi:hypothetical protein